MALPAQIDLGDQELNEFLVSTAEKLDTQPIILLKLIVQRFRTDGSEAVEQAHPKLIKYLDECASEPSKKFNVDEFLTNKRKKHGV